MNSKAQYTDRLARLAAQLPEEAGGALVTSQVCRLYLTGYNADTGFLLVTRKGCVFITDSRYIEAASLALDGVCEAVCYSKFGQTIKELCNKLEAGSLLIERSSLTLEEADRYSEAFEPITVMRTAHLDDILGAMRITKNALELEQIIAAQRLTEQCLRRLFDKVREGVSERELALELEFDMRRNGAERVAFDLIIAAGPNSSMPHAVPSDYKVKPGDFITFDIGSVINGYHSDMTRTVSFGKVSDEQMKVYETVRQAQAASIDYLIGGGTSCFEADRIARDIITNAGYGKNFGHGLGHGVGLEIHEEPRLSYVSTSILSEGCVVTVEPGIYLEGQFGVRIEDMVCITDGSAVDITEFEKELIVLD